MTGPLSINGRRAALPRRLRLAALALLVLAALLCAAVAAPVAAIAQTFPALTGRVVDAANVIPPDVEARLDQKLAAFEVQSHRQLVVATLPSLQGYEISDYGYRLGRSWGIGSKEHNDGALLIVAPNEHKLRIEVGYGLEGVLTDGLSSLIVQDTIVPKLKAGDMAGGIEAGTDAIIHQLTLPDAEARQLAAQARPQQAAASGGIPISTIIWLLFFLFFFMLPMIRRMRGGRSYGSGLGSVILWNALGSGGGGSSWGSGSSGGGGFSGGGGSFGGGGSSGSW